MQVRRLSELMSPEDAAAMRSVIKALQDYDALDDFIDEHAVDFEAYSERAEQKLEWTLLHQQYMSLVEGACHSWPDLGGDGAQIWLSLLARFWRRRCPDLVAPAVHVAP